MCLVHEQVWFMSTQFSWYSSVVSQIAYAHGIPVSLCATPLMCLKDSGQQVLGKLGWLDVLVCNCTIIAYIILNILHWNNTWYFLSTVIGSVSADYQFANTASLCSWMTCAAILQSMRKRICQWNSVQLQAVLNSLVWFIIMIIFHQGFACEYCAAVDCASAMLQHDGRIQSKLAAALLIRIGLLLH